MREQTISLFAGETRCRVSDSGRGDWVVLVHGLITPQFAWGFLFDALVAAGFKVVSYDLYGRGESAIPEVDYDFAFFLRQLDGVVAHFCQGQRHHMVGWSMGGAFASLYAIRHGHRLKQLTLISPGLVVSASHFIRQILQHKLASEVFARVGKRTLKQRLREQFHAPDGFGSYYDEATQQIAREGFWPSLISTIIHYPDDLLRIISYYPDTSPHPLIVWGEDDEITPYSDAPRIAALMKGKLLSVPEAAHAVHYEYPAQVNQHIVEHLKGDT